MGVTLIEAPLVPLMADSWKWLDSTRLSVSQERPPLWMVTYFTDVSPAGHSRTVGLTLVCCAAHRAPPNSDSATATRRAAIIYRVLFVFMISFVFLSIPHL